MRLMTLLLLSGFASGALAAQAVPPDLQPLPAPTVDTGNDSPVAADEGVTITKEAGDKVEEFRAGGRLYMIKVTPKHGQPYYLIDDHGDGKFSRQGSLDSGFRPPQWVIKKF